MRVAGRQKGSKVKKYTHIVVNPNAPKSRYTFSMHSSEAGANKAVEKYSRLVGDDLKVVKQAGRSPSTDMFEENIQEENKGLWHNIRMRRASGKKMRKKGAKGAPSPENMRSAQAASEDVPSTSTAAIPNPATTAMGPNYVHDRRRRKDKFPVMLKRFRKYIEDHG